MLSIIKNIKGPFSFTPESHSHIHMGGTCPTSLCGLTHLTLTKRQAGVHAAREGRGAAYEPVWGPGCPGWNDMADGMNA